jgi:1,2-diacylglycerol 3-beta-galactosyltransferase
MKTVDLIYFNAGGGHRAAALALEQVMQGERWQVRLVNLVGMLDPRDQFRKYTGIAPEDLYNKRLASGFTVGLTQELKILQYLIKLGHKTLIGKMQPYWMAARPDLVVSLIPNFNRALCESLTQTLPGVPYVTVLTDMADLPPHFWIEPDQPQHLICGTAHAAEQARVAGCAPQRIHRASGMILRPSFYELAPMDRTAERLKHGLDAQTPVGLVLFGGHGSAAMTGIAANAGDTPLILMCGKNAALAKALRATKAHAPRIVVEFTSDVAYWMRLADFFIGKPGPGSLSEAVHMGLPVIITRNAWTMPQERWNTEWVTQNGLGVVHGSFRTVQAAIAELTNNLPQWQAQVRQMYNRAVFEIPDILANLQPLEQPPHLRRTGQKPGKPGFV